MIADFIVKGERPNMDTIESDSLKLLIERSWKHQPIDRITISKVVSELEENVILASRNLGNVLLIDACEINVFDLVNADIVLMEEAAKNKVEEVLR